jgi:hypothetical protein
MSHWRDACDSFIAYLNRKLFNDALSIAALSYVALYEATITFRATVICFKVLSPNLPGLTEKNH